MCITVTVSLDGTTIISREFGSRLAAAPFIAEWSVGDFEVSVKPACRSSASSAG